MARSKTSDAQSLEKPIEKWTDEELALAELALAQEDPNYLIESGYLEIRTKQKELIPLRLNTIQKKLHDKILELKRQKKPIRIWLLKFRQGGCSTYTEAKIFAETSQRENINSLIMADQKEKSSNLFEMSKLFEERLKKTRSYLLSPLKKSNEKKLEWEQKHSQIIITSGENIDAARSFTYHFVHLSEVAYFRDLNGVLKALLQTVPDDPDTMVIGETTANGLGGDFYKEWQRAKKGQSDWVAVFFPWFLMEEYRRPLEPDGKLYPLTDVIYDTDGGYQDFIIEEMQLRKKYCLSEEQLNWRRWCIVNKCQGDVATFRQEYPADDEEAFLVSGKCIFDRVKLKQQKLDVKPPIAIGNLVEEDGKAVWRDDPKGYFRIHQWPEKEGQYCGGADGTRTLTGDPAAGVILNKKSNKTVAILHGHIDPDQFKLKLRLLGMFYNQCLIAPENNDIGKSIAEGLHAIYGKVYVKADEHGNIKDIGFKTNSVSRDEIISLLKQEIREGSTELTDELLIDEALNFIKNEDGKLAAAPGTHDDLMIARMIAGKMRHLNPYIPPKSDWKTKYKEKTKGSVWAS